MDAKEVKIPLALLAAGVAIYLGFAYYVAGTTGLAVEVIALSIQTVIGVAIMLVGVFITAKLLSISFGTLNTALLKLAAIYVLATAVGHCVPWAGWVLEYAAYYLLLMWLFELEGSEPWICAAVIWIVSFGVGFLGVILLTALKANTP